MTKLNKHKNIRKEIKYKSSKHNDCDKTNCSYYKNNICPGDVFICLKR